MARYSALVAPLSHTELVILGGSYGFECNLDDGYILNTSNMTLETVVMDDSSKFKF